MKLPPCIHRWSIVYLLLRLFSSPSAPHVTPVTLWVCVSVCVWWQCSPAQCWPQAAQGNIKRFFSLWLIYLLSELTVCEGEQKGESEFVFEWACVHLSLLPLCFHSTLPLVARAPLHGAKQMRHRILGILTTSFELHCVQRQYKKIK